MDNEQQRPADDELVREEEDAAAAQAGEIGGLGGAEDVADEAERPLAESGEGEAEGFEQAEAELIENAEHGEGNPEGDAFTPENAEAQRSGAEYGEADEIESTEVEDDTAGPEGG
jgi:hypothetical protein